MVDDHVQQFKNNASTLFGWQLSGIFGATSEQNTLCNIFSTPSNGGPGKSSFNRLFVPQAVSNPLCLRVDCSLAQDGSNIFINILTAVRNIFHIKLINALDNKPSTWLTLCNTLNSVRLKGFLLEDTTIGITCGLAGFSSPPNPDIGDNIMSAEGDLEVHNAASSLLSWELAALLHDESQIAPFCSNFSAYSGNINGINLDTSILHDIVCPFATQKLPNTKQLQKSFDEYWASIFSAHLFLVSDSMQYLQFLCKGYTAGKLQNFVKKLDDEVLKPKILAKCVQKGIVDVAGYGSF